MIHLWRVVSWIASKRLNDPCRFKDTLYADSYFRLEITRTGRKGIGGENG